MLCELPVQKNVSGPEWLSSMFSSKTISLLDLILCSEILVVENIVHPAAPSRVRFSSHKNQAHGLEQLVLYS